MKCSPLLWVAILAIGVACAEKDENEELSPEAEALKELEQELEKELEQNIWTESGENYDESEADCGHCKKKREAGEEEEESPQDCGHCKKEEAGRERRSTSAAVDMTFVKLLDGWSPPSHEVALDCDPETCKLPKCYCSEDGRQIPGGLKWEETPQMIMVSSAGNFLTEERFDFIKDLLKDKDEAPRVNPNGCPAKATFFISTPYTNFQALHALMKEGHELGVHGMSLQGFEGMSPLRYAQEMLGTKGALSDYSQVPQDLIKGGRNPQLAANGDAMFYSHTYDSDDNQNSLLYDSTLKAKFFLDPFWPMTLDHRVPFECVGQTCPTLSFPGAWVLPLNEIDGRGQYTVKDADDNDDAKPESSDEDESSGEESNDEDDDKQEKEEESQNKTVRYDRYDLQFPGSIPVDEGCSVPLACSKSINSYDAFQRVLMATFLRHYTTNKAPMHLYISPGTLDLNPEVTKKALEDFLDDVLSTYPNVYLVRINDVVEWMKAPTPVDQLKDFGPWKAKGGCLGGTKEESGDVDKPEWPACIKKSHCKFPDIKVHNFYTCSGCPNYYPAIKMSQDNRLDNMIAKFVLEGLPAQ